MWEKHTGRRESKQSSLTYTVVSSKVRSGGEQSEIESPSLQGLCCHTASAHLHLVRNFKRWLDLPKSPQSLGGSET